MITLSTSSQTFTANSIEEAEQIRAQLHKSGNTYICIVINHTKCYTLCIENKGL